jgi:hypothetical protein
MKTQLLRTLTGLATLLAGAAATAAQDSPLGSPAASAGRFTTDYAEAVRAALPPVDAGALAKLVAAARSAAAAEKPLAAASPRGLERAFGLRERGDADAFGFIDAGDAVYRVDPERQRFHLTYRNVEPKRVPREEFKREAAAIREAHLALADRLGIPRHEVFFVDAREILSETDGHPELEKGVQGEILAEGVVTTMLRAVGGILVEGSYARLSSVDAQRLELVDVRWPAVRLSDAALERGLRSPREVVESITRRVTESSKGAAINVRMALVLRPLEPSKERRGVEFVPALKVGVEPQSIRTEDGYRTDAGEVFYVDLVKGAPPFADADAPDAAEPDARPKG